MFPEYMTVIFTAPNITVDEANQKFEPLVSFAKNATGGAVSYTTPTYGSFIEWWNANLGSGSGAPAQVGGNAEIASRLLPRELAEECPEEIARIGFSLGGFATK